MLCSVIVSIWPWFWTVWLKTVSRQMSSNFNKLYDSIMHTDRMLWWAIWMPKAWHFHRLDVQQPVSAERVLLLCGQWTPDKAPHLPAWCRRLNTRTYFTRLYTFRYVTVHRYRGSQRTRPKLTQTVHVVSIRSLDYSSIPASYGSNSSGPTGQFLILFFLLSIPLHLVAWSPDMLSLIISMLTIASCMFPFH